MHLRMLGVQHLFGGLIVMPYEKEGVMWPSPYLVPLTGREHPMPARG